MDPQPEAAASTESTASTESAARPADRLDGLAWVALGALITVGALRIDRLAAQGVEWFAAPGLLPGVLGLIIAVNGLLISWRAQRQWAASSRSSPPAKSTLSDGTSWRVALTLLLCLGFAIGLVGHGLPFGLAAGAYLLVHVSLLQWDERGAAGQRLRGLAVAAAVAVGGGLIVPYIFESVFLVRLP